MRRRDWSHRRTQPAMGPMAGWPPQVRCVFVDLVNIIQRELFGHFALFSRWKDQYCIVCMLSTHYPIHHPLMAFWKSKWWVNSVKPRWELCLVSKCNYCIHVKQVLKWWEYNIKCPEISQLFSLHCFVFGVVQITIFYLNFFFLYFYFDSQQHDLQMSSRRPVYVTRALIHLCSPCWHLLWNPNRTQWSRERPETLRYLK